MKQREVHEVGIPCPRCGRDERHDECASCGNPVCADRDCTCGSAMVVGACLALAIVVVTLSQFFRF
jgi:hypothetical protein